MFYLHVDGIDMSNLRVDKMLIFRYVFRRILKLLGKEFEKTSVEIKGFLANTLTF